MFISLSVSGKQITPRITLKKKRKKNVNSSMSKEVSLKWRWILWSSESIEGKWKWGGVFARASWKLAKRVYIFREFITAEALAYFNIAKEGCGGGGGGSQKFITLQPVYIYSQWRNYNLIVLARTYIIPLSNQGLGISIRQHAGLLARPRALSKCPGLVVVFQVSLPFN